MSNHSSRNANDGASRRFANLQFSVRLQIELSDFNGNEETGISSFGDKDEDEDEEDEVDSEDEIAPELNHKVALIQENNLFDVNEALMGSPRKQPLGDSADYEREEANNPTDPAMAKFIDEMEYAQVFLGRVKIPKKTHHKVKAQGPMNAREKHLIQFINTALQYPPVIDRCTRFSQQTMRNYSFSIRRYVLFMANKGFTKDNFEVNGVRMVECMKNYEQLNIMEDGTTLPPAHGVIQNFKFGLQALQFCLGFYHTRKITDEKLRRRKREEICDKILHFDVIDLYSKESKRCC